MHEMIVSLSHFLSIHQWLVTDLLILLGMTVFHWFSRKTYHFLCAKLDKTKHSWFLAFIQSVHVPWLTFFWLMAISFMIPIFMLHFHIDLTKLAAVNTIRSLLFMGALYWSLLKFIKKIEEEVAPRWARMPTHDKTTLRAIVQISRIVLTILIGLFVLPILGFHIGGLLAFGGVGGIVAGFAAKDSLSNFLGGMMIFLDRPFSVGDWIRSPDRNIEGTVEYIGWRLTRLRTFSKRPLYVPNSVFSTISIENATRMSNRRIDTLIGVRYDDARVIGVIVKAIDAMLHAHPDIDTTQPVMVHFTEFAASSLNINLYCFTKTTDWAKYRGVQQDVFLKAIAIIAEHGAECAFPTTTVHLSHGESSPDQQPGEPVHAN